MKQKRKESINCYWEISPTNLIVDLLILNQINFQKFVKIFGNDSVLW